MSQPQFGQYPQAPVYPPAPQFPAQPAPQYVPQQYAPAPAAPQAPAGPAGTLDDFLGQPSTGGGPSLKFNQKPNGTSYAGIVARPIIDSDVRAQTDQQNRPVFHKDGRPKLVLVVPLLVAESPEFPEGRASWWVKGMARDELAQAMQRAGSTAKVPEAGAQVTVTLTGTRAIPNMSPQLLFAVQYVSPAGASAPAPEPVQAEAPAPAAAPAPAPAAAPAAAPVGGPTPEQAALLAQLAAGGQAK